MPKRMKPENHGNVKLLIRIAPNKRPMRGKNVNRKSSPRSGIGWAGEIATHQRRATPYRASNTPQPLNQ